MLRTRLQLDNQVVIWDRIVRRKQDAKIRIENGRNKYYLKEHSGSFRYVRTWFAHAQGLQSPLFAQVTDGRFVSLLGGVSFAGM